MYTFSEFLTAVVVGIAVVTVAAALVIMCELH